MRVEKVWVYTERTYEADRFTYATYTQRKIYMHKHVYIYIYAHIHIHIHRLGAVEYKSDVTFVFTSSPGDGPKLGGKYLGNN